MQNLLSIENVSLTKNGVNILKNINLTVKRDENWAIIGRNGSGKSFLLKIISTVLFPSDGSVSVMGSKLGEVNIWDLRTKIGFVSDALQREYKHSEKVFDVIGSGFFASNGLYGDITNEMALRIEEILDILSIRHLKDREFGRLSQGEQKRVLIGRSIVFSPELLVLDEPCSGLDTCSREEFLAVLSRLAKDHTRIIIVTHHIEEIIPEITNVLFLKNGYVYDSGRTSEMITSRKISDVIGTEMEVLKKKGRYWTKLW